jgi:hypothetical protein
VGEVVAVERQHRLVICQDDAEALNLKTFHRYHRPDEVFQRGFVEPKVSVDVLDEEIQGGLLVVGSWLRKNQKPETTNH